MKTIEQKRFEAVERQLKFNKHSWYHEWVENTVKKLPAGLQQRLQEIHRNQFGG